MQKKKIDPKHRPVLKKLETMGYKFSPLNGNYGSPRNPVTRYELEGFERALFLDIYKDCRINVFNTPNEPMYLNLVCKVMGSCQEQTKSFKPLKKGGYNWELMGQCIENVKPKAQEFIDRTKEIVEAKEYNTKLFAKVIKAQDELNERYRSVSKAPYGNALDINHAYTTVDNKRVLIKGKCEVYLGSKTAYLTPAQALRYIRFIHSMLDERVFDERGAK